MRKVLCLLFVLTLLPGQAETSISDVVVSQRWPWSEKVDVDFLVTGGTADMQVSAVWDGREEPYELGVVSGAKPGWNRLTWDPAASSFAGRTLTGFSVSVRLDEVPEDRYLIIDLVNGNVSYTTRPDGIDGTWSDAYKSKKMVFRRVPAGTYRLGMTTDELCKWYGESSTNPYKDENRLRGSRSQTFTSDFYLAVFQMTVAQYETVFDNASSNDLLPKRITYDELRGTTNETDGICWPATRYNVAQNSFLGRLRTRVEADLTIDLPTEEQWEVAARAGTATVFPNGGTADSADNELWAIFGKGGWYYDNGGTELKPVGLRKADNAWGFFDLFANCREWTLDVWMLDGYGRPVKPESGTDSVGYLSWKTTENMANESNIKKVNSAYGQRVVRSAFPQFPSSFLSSALPSARAGASPQSMECTARLCIHLSPLAFPD